MRPNLPKFLISVYDPQFQISYLWSYDIFALYTNSTNKGSVSSGNPSFATTAGSDLGFVAAKTVK